MNFNIWYFLACIALGIFVAYMGWPLYVVFISIGVFFILQTTYIFYIVFVCQHNKLLTRFVDKQRKIAIYEYAYLLREGTDEQIVRALEKILKKYKAPKYQATYGASYYVLQKNYQAARDIVIPIQHSEIGQYTLGLIAASEGKREEALRYTYTKPWMKHSILANLAFAEGNIEEFNEHSTLAISQSKGLQRYSNFYAFNRLKEAFS